MNNDLQVKKVKEPTAIKLKQSPYYIMEVGLPPKLDWKNGLCEKRYTWIIAGECYDSAFRGEAISVSHIRRYASLDNRYNLTSQNNMSALYIQQI